MSIMGQLRRLFRREPDKALTEAIREHDRAVAESQRATREAESISKDLQKNAVQAIAILERTWRVQRHDQRL